MGQERDDYADPAPPPRLPAGWLLAMIAVLILGSGFGLAQLIADASLPKP